MTSEDGFGKSRAKRNFRFAIPGEEEEEKKLRSEMKIVLAQTSMRQPNIFKILLFLHHM